MNDFSLDIFLYQIHRSPVKRVLKLLDKYQKQLNNVPEYKIKEILEYLEYKFNIVSTWIANDAIKEIGNIKKIATKIPKLTDETFYSINYINKLHQENQIELQIALAEYEKLNLLYNFPVELSNRVVENFIVSLNSTHQRNMITKYKDKILEDDYEHILSFLASLKYNIQLFFLSEIDDYIKKLSIEDFSKIPSCIYEFRLDLFYRNYYDYFKSLDKEDFIKYLILEKSKQMEPFNKIEDNKSNILIEEFIEKNKERKYIQ